MGKPGRFAARRAILSVQPQAEDDAIAAGRGAEAALRGLMRDSHALKSARIFHSKRVPKVMGRASGRLPGGGGRFEIDLIVVTPRQLTAIEIKNWSGELRVENGRWLQKRRNGEDLDHGDVLALNSQKLDVLTAFLAAKSLRAPPLLSSRVMLWNKNLQLAPMLRDHPAVIERHALRGAVSECRHVIAAGRRGGRKAAQTDPPAWPLENAQTAQCTG
ncbi:nuclease-related domain-containing protein [Abyssibius alkaniclasticus]|uniref:nuclease-related domain-containing protein n=1 Tax=Abyssibius alkaniclasticus TaxID=2881234 RepID=UPI004058A518